MGLKKHKWILFGELKVNRHIKKDLGQGHMPHKAVCSIPPMATEQVRHEEIGVCLIPR